VDREKSAFMATITHEMRTPLHGVIGNTQLALEALEVYEEPPDAAMLHAALAGARQLGELIDRILDAHRLQAGKMELHLIPTDLREVIEEAVQSVAPRMARGANRLIQQAHAGALVSIDRGKILQVLQNLLEHRSHIHAALAIIISGCRAK
jgi:signal transduction histidine kinase